MHGRQLSQGYIITYRRLTQTHVICEQLVIITYLRNQRLNMSVQQIRK